MAIGDSDVSICNLALQKLGASSIASLSDASNNANACQICYGQQRDRELQAHYWNFAKSRAVLAPLTTAPLFDYTYAFPLPSDFLRIIITGRFDLDWKVEMQNGQRVILTNDGNSINFQYIARITDPTQFDPLFVDALAAKMGWHMCERLTQSNEKKKDLAQEYKDAIGEARRVNALSNTPDVPALSEWAVAQVFGLSSGSEVSAPIGSWYFPG